MVHTHLGASPFPSRGETFARHLQRDEPQDLLHYETRAQNIRTIAQPEFASTSRSNTHMMRSQSSPNPPVGSTDSGGDTNLEKVKVQTKARIAELEAIGCKHADDMHLLRCLRDFVKEKARADVEYGQRLRALASSYLDQLSKSPKRHAGVSVTSRLSNKGKGSAAAVLLSKSRGQPQSADKSSQCAGELRVYDALHCALVQTEVLGAQRVAFSMEHIAPIVHTMDEFEERKSASFKAVLATAKFLHEELQSTFTELEEAQKAHIRAFRRLDQCRSRLDRKTSKAFDARGRNLFKVGIAETAVSMQRAAELLESTAAEVHPSRQNFILSVTKANAHQAHYYDRQLPGLLDDLDAGFVDAVRTAIGAFAMAECQFAQSAAQYAAEATRPARDMAWEAEKRVVLSQMLQIRDHRTFAFERVVADESPDLAGESDTIIATLSVLRGELEVLRGEFEAHSNRVAWMVSSAETKRIDSANEEILRNARRELLRVERKIAQLNAQICQIEKEIGGAAATTGHMQRASTDVISLSPHSTDANQTFVAPLTMAHLAGIPSMNKSSRVYDLLRHVGANIIDDGESKSEVTANKFGRRSSTQRSSTTSKSSVSSRVSGDPPNYSEAMRSASPSAVPAHSAAQQPPLPPPRNPSLPPRPLATTVGPHTATLQSHGEAIYNTIAPAGDGDFRADLSYTSDNPFNTDPFEGDDSVCAEREAHFSANSTLTGDSNVFDAEAHGSFFPSHTDVCSPIDKDDDGDGSTTPSQPTVAPHRKPPIPPVIPRRTSSIKCNGGFFATPPLNSEERSMEIEHEMAMPFRRESTNPFENADSSFAAVSSTGQAFDMFVMTHTAPCEDLRSADKAAPASVCAVNGAPPAIPARPLPCALPADRLATKPSPGLSASKPSLQPRPYPSAGRSTLCRSNNIKPAPVDGSCDPFELPLHDMNPFCDPSVDGSACHNLSAVGTTIASANGPQRPQRAASLRPPVLIAGGSCPHNSVDFPRQLPRAAPL
eukprot:Opistho-2@76497